LAYCTASDVRLIVETSLTDTEISGIIEMSDAEIDSRLGSQSASDKLIKKLSVLLTAHAIKTRQPKIEVIGEYREDAGSVLEVWEREIERFYRLYRDVKVKASDYRHIEEGKRYPEV
jgi:hypothetical protein